LDIKKWVKSIQTAGYIGARTVHRSRAALVEQDTIDCEYLAYFEPKTNLKKNIYKRDIMQLFSADAIVFKKKI
jgi:hypothetical protein